MKPVRFKSDLENWVFSNRFSSQRENQNDSETEKGTFQIEFGEPQNDLSHVFHAFNDGVAD